MTPRPPRPRWSNTRIGRLPQQVRLDHPPWHTAQSIIDACRLIRDDYESEYQRLCERILELEAIIERGDREYRTLHRRLAELEAER